MDLFDEHLEAVSTVKSHQKTGVEMEALTAVTVTALTIYDMVKGVDKSVYIKEISLLEKKGGKTGDYKNEKGINPCENRPIKLILILILRLF